MIQPYTVARFDTVTPAVSIVIAPAHRSSREVGVGFLCTPAEVRI
jgi:hypothetical protein